MSTGQMSVNHVFWSMSDGQVSDGQMFVGQVSDGQMFVSQMSVRKMQVGQMFFDRKTRNPPTKVGFL